MNNASKGRCVTITPSDKPVDFIRFAGIVQNEKSDPGALPIADCRHSSPPLQRFNAWSLDIVNLACAFGLCSAKSLHESKSG